MPLLRFPVLWWGKLRQQKHDGSQKPLGAVIEESVLAVLGSVTVRVDDGFGEDLGVFFCSCPGTKVVRMLARDVHVMIHQRQKIETVRACGITQVNDGYLVAVIPGGDGSVVSRQVPLGIQRQIAHAAGAGVLQVCV